MLKIVIPKRELYDEEKNEFLDFPGQTLQLEHSLVSLSKWESKWKKPFLENKTPTNEEAIDYVRCMTITQNVNPLAYRCLTQENVSAVYEYINDPMTATTISDMSRKNGKKEIITSEVIYYWMIEAGVPFECQKWHLNRLLTLISVISIKRSPPKKMTKSERAAYNRQLNAQRLKQYNTKG